MDTSDPEGSLDSEKWEDLVGTWVRLDRNPWRVKHGDAIGLWSYIRPSAQRARWYPST
jgi:hypothetical protein